MLKKTNDVKTFLCCPTLLPYFSSAFAVYLAHGDLRGSGGPGPLKDAVPELGQR